MELKILHFLTIWFLMTLLVPGSLGWQNILKLFSILNCMDNLQYSMSQWVSRWKTERGSTWICQPQWLDDARQSQERNVLKNPDQIKKFFVQAAVWEIRTVRGLHLQGLHNHWPGSEVQDILLPFCPQFWGRCGLLELGDLQVREGVSQVWEQIWSGGWEIWKWETSARISGSGRKILKIYVKMSC